MTILFANNGASALAAAISDVATTANLTPGTGAKFPLPTNGDYFAMTITDANTGVLNEIVYVTERDGDTITIQRGQEGTTPQAWNAGDFIDNLVTAGTMAAMQQSADLFPVRTITASGAFVTNKSNRSIGLNRTSSLAASSTILPADADPGDEYWYDDLVGNLNKYPLTVAAPAGMKIANEDQWVCNVNRGSYGFKYYGGNIWSVNFK